MDGVFDQMSMNVKLIWTCKFGDGIMSAIDFSAKVDKVSNSHLMDQRVPIHLFALAGWESQGRSCQAHTRRKIPPIHKMVAESCKTLLNSFVK